MKQITFKEYRSMDLMLLTVLVIIFEALATYASGRWFYAQPIAISITLTLVCIAMMRWSGYAAILAIVGGFVYCFASGATVEQYLIYCVGNLMALVGLVFIKIYGKEAIRRSVLKLIGYVLLSYIGMAAGRWLVSLLFGGDMMALVVYATTDIISLLFASIVLILLRNLDGMLEDQKAYLFRVERESKEENAFEENDVIL